MAIPIPIAQTPTIHSNNKAMFSKDDDRVKHCPSCGIRTIFNGHDANYVVKPVGKYDIFSTGEFIDICTEKFRDFFIKSGYTGVKFLSFRSSPGFYQLQVMQSLPFDSIKRGARFIDKCEMCGNFQQVIGAMPVFLMVQSLGSDGIYKSDILFGQFGSKNPLLIFGNGLIKKMEEYGISKFHYHPVYGTDTEFEDARHVAIEKMKRERGY